VDPNGGCTSDAVEVYCNFTNGIARTCVLPTRRQAERKSWEGDSIWFSTFQGGFQVQSLHSLQCNLGAKGVETVTVHRWGVAIGRGFPLTP